MPTPEETTTIPQPQEVVKQPQEEQRGSYTSLYERFSPNPLPDEKDMTAMAEQRRQQGAIFALADAMSGMANIIGAANGAAPMDITPMSTALDDRYTKMTDRIRARKEAYDKGMIDAAYRDHQAKLTAEEKEADRIWRAEEAEKGRGHQKVMQDDQQAFQAGENEKNREADTKKTDKTIKANENINTSKQQTDTTKHNATLEANKEIKEKELKSKENIERMKLDEASWTATRTANYNNIARAVRKGDQKSLDKILDEVGQREYDQCLRILKRDHPEYFGNQEQTTNNNAKTELSTKI